MNHTISKEAILALKREEGLSLVAYRDQGGVYTIGYGHTGPEVHVGLVWTLEQAEAALLLDLGAV